MIFGCKFSIDFLIVGPIIPADLSTAVLYHHFLRCYFSSITWVAAYWQRTHKVAQRVIKTLRLEFDPYLAITKWKTVTCFSRQVR